MRKLREGDSGTADCAHRPAVLYARVSSKDQEKEGYSIPAQLDLLRGYAFDHRLNVLKEFLDVETAKAAGRCAFGEMIDLLRKNKRMQDRTCGKNRPPIPQSQGLGDNRRPRPRNPLRQSNVVGDPHLDPNRSRGAVTGEWFNIAAFVANPVGTDGTSGRKHSRWPRTALGGYRHFPDVPSQRTHGA